MTSQSRPRPLAAYLRLTVDRNGDKIGYTVQREDIERYAKAMGYELVWFQDKGITAANRKVVRPEYERMLKEMAAGKFSGIIVWRLDRLVRLTREFERCFAVVEDAKAVIIEAKTGLRTDSDTGRLVIRILVMLAEMEISAMVERARGHHSLRAKDGELSTGGCRPFGFVGVERDPETKAIINREEAGIKHDRREAALMRDAAERVAFRGATYNDIAREWASLDPPVVGTEGGSFSGGRVREILTSPRAAGYREYEVLNEDGEVEGTHLAKAKKWKAIIPEKTWQVLRSRAKEEATGPRSTKSEYLFTGGAAKCGTCEKPMIGFTLPDSKKTKDRVPGYRCNASVRAIAAGACGKPLVRADYLEDTVLEQLFARLEEMPELYDAVNSAPDDNEAELREATLREIRECNAKLREIGERVALREDDLEHLSEAEAAGRTSGFRKRLAAAQDDLKRLSANAGYPTPTETDRLDIRRWFNGLSLGERRSWLATQITDIFVDPVQVRSPSFDPRRVRTLFTDAKSAH